MRVECRKNGVTGNKIADKKVKYQIKLLCNYINFFKLILLFYST